MTKAMPAQSPPATKPETSTRDILASVGEVAYTWTLGDDRILWDGDPEVVIGIPAARLPTGRALAAFQDSGSPINRRDAILGGKLADRGKGVAFHAEYGLRPDGTAGPTVWIEDFGRWFADDGGQPARVVGVLRVINDRYERDRQLAYRSSHDELTGAYNRTYLLECLDEILKSTQRLRSTAAFLLVSVDNFRLINDTYGFDVADQVLAVVARRIQAQLRSGDALGRCGGNKLGCILGDCDESAMALAATRLLASVRDEVVATKGGTIAATVSIGGVALPRHARTVAEATTRAEESLQAARAHGTGRFAAYVPEPGREEGRRRHAALSTAMIRALQENRLSLAFQPIVDIVTRAPVMHEALLRLEGLDGETISAGSFMPLSARLGLSRLLDTRALELAIAALKANPDVRLSVNVTPETAADPVWLGLVAAALGHAPRVAGRLTVEITETAAIRDLDDAARFVDAVKELGCLVALDDFGAGYTSYRTLRQLAIDIVKIDGAYIENLATSPDDQLFVRTLTDLARGFGLKTVAEWVRDEDSAAILRAWGVDYIQGALTGEPVRELPDIVGRTG